MNIIVNGGTKGIGKEIVLILAENRNYRIIVTGRNRKALQLLSSPGASGNIIPYSLDLASFDEHEKEFRNMVISHFKHVDILINTAGVLITKDFMDFTSAEAREMMETNFIGTSSVIRTIQPLMKKGSHIVNIASMGGFQGSSKYRGLSFYSASKAAMACLSECLAVEFNKAGIVVNCLALGSVGTEMFEKAFPGLKAPVKAGEMAELIVDFAIRGRKFYNGKVIPVAFNNP
jgi:NAD(P)-dependent dehydrogenase (short-subunit alcohol dehydrogenase family)